MSRGKQKPAKRQVNKRAGQEITQVEQKFHQGPIPDPETLAGYNQIVPNAAERILRMAEIEADHRQSLESSTLQANIRDRVSVRYEMKLGQTLAFAYRLLGVEHTLQLVARNCSGWVKVYTSKRVMLPVAVIAGGSHIHWG